MSTKCDWAQHPTLDMNSNKRLYRWLLKMARIRYGQLKQDLFDQIQSIVIHLKWETKFANGHPDKMWYCLFLNCFPDLKLQQDQALSCQCVGILQNALDLWFHVLFEYFEEMGNLSILQEPLHIFNTDETGFPMAPYPTKVLAGKGDPHVYQQGSSDKLQITVLMTSNAIALYVPPLIVYLGCNFCQMFMENFYSNFLSAIFGHSANGWMDADLFEKWLEESFIPEVEKAWILKPVLLMIDGTKCHISLPISKLCDEHNIILYTLLPNATHLIQLFDLSLMGSIKTHYHKCVRKWLQNHLGTVYNKNMFIEVFSEVNKATTVENAVSSFQHLSVGPTQGQQ